MLRCMPPGLPALAAPDRKPAGRHWGRGDQSEREYPREVLVLVTHGDGHDEHDTEVRGVRGEIEIKEQPVR